MELIPAPRAVEEPTGPGVPLGPGTTLWAAAGTERTERWLRATLGAALNLPLRPGPPDARDGVRLLLDDTLPPEAYRLTARAGDGVEIRGGGPAGVFWGAQTLRQLLGADAFRRAPCARPRRSPCPPGPSRTPRASAGAVCSSTSPGTSCPRRACCAIWT